MYLWHYQVKNMTNKVVILLLCSQVTTVFSSHHCGDGGGPFSVLDLNHRSYDKNGVIFPPGNFLYKTSSRERGVKKHVFPFFNFFMDCVFLAKCNVQNIK